MSLILRGLTWGLGALGVFQLGQNFTSSEDESRAKGSFFSLMSLLVLSGLVYLIFFKKSKRKR